jgi:hypothetical protein
MADMKRIFAGYVQKTVQSSIDARPRTVSYDVMSRYDVDDESGLTIGSLTPVDASACQINTDVTFVAPV